jgi:hypothetical protein
MQRLISLRQLHGDYGAVAAGEYFEAPVATARILIARGLAMDAAPPKIVLEMVGQKVIYRDPQWDGK